MEYLFKLYYQDKEKYNETYENRIKFETTLRTSLSIKPFKHSNNYELYYVYNNHTANLIDRIRKNDDILKLMEENLPGVARTAFLIDIISNELKSTNDLEGIETDKSELAQTTRNIIENQKMSTRRFSSMINSYILLMDKNSLKLPVDSNDIRTIYDKITEGEIEESDLPDGKYFRLKEVFVQKKNNYSGEVIHKGISDEIEIERHIMQMLSFLNNTQITLLLRVAIGHYFFGYIHPFYDGNGRIGRFISSLYIQEEYSYLTAMSLARGSYINKSRYYKAFSQSNLPLNRGEMNFFIDEFLLILISGQEDIIDNLYDKIGKLNHASECIEKDDKYLDTELKKTLMFLLSQSYYFDYSSGITRINIIENLKGQFSVNRIKIELKELVESGLIKEIKKNPLVYAIEEDYLE